MEDRRHQHLEFVAAVVDRMASNSFSLKEWSVTLVAALFALSAAIDDAGELVWCALLPAVVFWGLDGYFLWMERRYRVLWDHVRKAEQGTLDSNLFSMDTTPHAAAAGTYFEATFSKTLLWFHGAVLVAVVIAIAILG